MTLKKKKRIRSSQIKEKDRVRRLRAEVLKATEGQCPHCGFYLFTGGPATESEYPLECRGNECAQEVQITEVVLA